MKPYYQEEGVTIYHGDCRDMSEVPSDSIDLIVTSPPYLKGKDYERGMSFDYYVGMILDAYRECYRVLAPSGIAFINVNNHNALRLLAFQHLNFLLKVGFLFVEDIIWLRKNSTHYRSHKRLVDLKEYIWLVAKTDAYKLYPERYLIPTEDTYGNRYGFWKPLNNVWVIPEVKHNQFRYYGHPTEFPEELVARAISVVDCKIVLDPFLGRGTTACCAKKLGRKCIGYEISEKYCEIAADRCRQMVMEL